MMKKLSKIITALLLMLVAILCATGISPVFNFAPPQPFAGPDIYDPYRYFDPEIGWKRANFHTYTKVDGLFNECDFPPAQVREALRRFGYDIVTFSNHNALTSDPDGDSLQVNLYEHGYNLLKFHKLVFGSDKVCRYDNLLPILPSQRQHQLDMLASGADIVQLNHPYRTDLTMPKTMQRLEGYRLIELDSGVGTANSYWDQALSAGHYSFATASDDLHYPDRTSKIAVRCTFLCCRSAQYEDILSCLEGGSFYCMRVPDYGDGCWEEKYEKNRHLPKIDTIGLRGGVVFMKLDRPASHIVATGQGGVIISDQYDLDSFSYELLPEDTYVRLTAYFDDGCVIYTNPFARYDSSLSTSPFGEPSHRINVLLTILFNLLLLVVAGGCAKVIVLLFRKNETFKE